MSGPKPTHLAWTATQAKPPPRKQNQPGVNWPVLQTLMCLIPGFILRGQVDTSPNLKGWCRLFPISYIKKVLIIYSPIAVGRPHDTRGSWGWRLTQTRMSTQLHSSVSSSSVLQVTSNWSCGASKDSTTHADNSLAGGDGGQELAPTLALTASLVKVSRGAAVRPAISLPVPDLDVCSLLAWSDLICSFSQWTSIQGVLPVFSIPTPCSCVLQKQFQRIHSYNPTYRKLNLAHFSS